MANQNGSIITQRLIAEVAARHNVFLKPDDPAIALVTMNQLILDDAMDSMHGQIRATIAEFHASMQKAEERAGTRTSSETLDAELDLFRARAGVVNAQVNASEAQIRLELALGRRL